MNTTNARTLLLSGAVLSALAAFPAFAGGPGIETTLGMPANRLAGLWRTEAGVRPCGTQAPLSTVLNTLVFNAGGTAIENPMFPPGGVPGVYGVPGVNQRTAGLGRWSYNPLTGRHTLHLRFDWYVDGAYHGYQTVDRQMQLSHNLKTVTGPVKSVRYAADGSTIIEICGTATSYRL